MTISAPAWAEKLEDPDVQLGGHINALRGVMRGRNGQRGVCSQQQLGEAIGVTQATMSKKLRGEVGITFAELLMLAEFFELSIEDLIPPKYAGERVIKSWYTPRDSNPEPADKEPHLYLVKAA